MKNADKRLLKKFAVTSASRGKLNLYATDDRTFFDSDEKDKAREALTEDAEKLRDLQRVLWAQGKHAVLLVLQGMDTSGKDGTIRHVLGPLNPQGVFVSSFKKPTDLEWSYDYLWRVHKQVPPKGYIGVFNRSHYEDILVPYVTGSVPARQLQERYDQINDFEKYLSQNGVTILKFFLHISKAEQKERLLARLEQPHKNWKFNPSDLESRQKWPRYQEAYESILARCSKKWARWFVVPADRKWYRNFVVGRLLRLTLEDLDLSYPPPMTDLEDIVIPD
jgi:PPK2 family polyphosphate:nucleotide phosphotransferase